MVRVCACVQPCSYSSRQCVILDPHGYTLVCNAETLPDYSALEMCRVLGALREDKHVLDKASSKKHNKKDVFISVPLLALSEVVQRFVNIERAGKQEAVEKLAVAEADIATLRSQLEELPEDDVMV